MVAADQPPKRRKGGNARVQWQNFKLQQYKQRVAPSRALTDDELEAFYRKCERQWTEAGMEEKQAWTDIWKGRPAPEGQIVVQPEGLQQTFQKVWALGEASRFLPVPAASLVEQHRQKTFRERRALAEHDPDLLVRSSCDDRVCASNEDESDKIMFLVRVSGCQEECLQEDLGR